MRLERESGSHVLTLTEMHHRLVNSVYLDRWRDRDTPPCMNALLCKAVVHDSLSRGINIVVMYYILVISSCMWFRLVLLYYRVYIGMFYIIRPYQYCHKA